MTPKVKNVYPGKPDARYEITSLKENMILPPNFSMDDIIKGDKYYIIGNKGIGKTALLLYISNYLSSIDENSICSTILFKTDYNSTERMRLTALEDRILEELDVTTQNGLNISSYTNVWKLTLYLKIVLDNQQYGYKIFTNDINWNAFESLILRLSDSTDIGMKERLSIIKKIPKIVNIDYKNSRIYMESERLDFPKKEDTIELKFFNMALDLADNLFSMLERLDYTYFLCIDELETSFGSKYFLRDLQMIHDWIEAVNELNTKIQSHKYKRMKVILSVRNEIIRSIENHLCGDELNKKIMSYRVLLDWKIKNGANISNPLFLIWLKRISNLYENQTNIDYLKIRQEWFPPDIGTEDTVDFILNRTWYKPRDIVRFIMLCVQTADENASTFSRDLIVSALDEYSKDSKTEIMEEMSAFYKSDCIALLFSTLKNFKIRFTKEEYEQHCKEDYCGNEFFNNIDNLLTDLYRFGVLGCVNIETGVQKWNYQGETSMMQGPKWHYCVHPGLWYCLELEKAYYDNVNFYEIKAVPLDCTVERTNQHFAFVTFYFAGKTHNGVIHVSNFANNGEFIQDLSQRVSRDQKILAYVDRYDEHYMNWVLTCKPYSFR